MGNLLRKAALYLGFGSAVAIIVSIAVSQILLALSLTALLLSGDRLRFPPLRLPLLAFVATTLAALLTSGDPLSGTPQVRKFFVFAIVLVVYSTFESIRKVQYLIVAWAGAGSLSALVAVAQYFQRRQEALREHADLYGYVLDGRITGFAGHWMTFGGEEMIVLLMLAALLLFCRGGAVRVTTAPLFAILWFAITLGMTRSIFLLGVPLGLIYLLWRRNFVFIIGIPLFALIGIDVAPIAIRERVASVVKPHGDVDSNEHRAVCRAVGWEMVKAHPWFGLGPEQIGKQFDRYVPARISRPLPHGWYGHLHNIYLQYAAERGIPALLSILWLIGKSVRDFLRFLRDKSLSRESVFILHGAIAVILAILAEGLFEYNLGDSEVLTMFLAVIACGYVAGKPHGETPAVNESIQVCLRPGESTQSGFCVSSPICTTAGSCRSGGSCPRRAEPQATQPA